MKENKSLEYGAGAGALIGVVFSMTQKYNAPKSIAVATVMAIAGAFITNFINNKK